MRQLEETFGVGVAAMSIVSGPIFGFSDTWQLIINTGTAYPSSTILASGTLLSTNGVMALGP